MFVAIQSDLVFPYPDFRQLTCKSAIDKVSVCGNAADEIESCLSRNALCILTEIKHDIACKQRLPSKPRYFQQSQLFSALRYETLYGRYRTRRHAPDFEVLVTVNTSEIAFLR